MVLSLWNRDRTAQLTACSGDSRSQEEEGKGPVDVPEKQETPQEGAAVSVRAGVMGVKGVSGVGMKDTSSLWWADHLGKAHGGSWGSIIWQYGPVA